MYIDAHFDRGQDKILVVERIEGERVFKELSPIYEFYYSDPTGNHKSIYNLPVKKVTASSKKGFHKELSIHSNKQIYESDINPLLKCLERYYRNKPSPKLNMGVIDIEVDFDMELGFASPNDPTSKITAITTYLSHIDKLVTFTIPPEEMSSKEAEKIVCSFEDTLLFTNERQLLLSFLDLIQDIDIITGWNSEGYDLPYLINRVTKVLSKNDTRKFCLWDKLPKKKEYERYGAKQQSYELIGRVHIDYLDLYRKYTYHELHSYSLDTVADYELGDRKVPYEGTLDQLYHNDYAEFIAYNRQDVMLIVNLDRKHRFIELANELAHENSVLLPTTLGAVAMTEQAIINITHDLGMVVPDRKKAGTKEDAVVGAFVANPKKGLHKWVGSIDINSLYPSAIRALNMGPESIVGQVRHSMTDSYIQNKISNGATRASAWEGLFGTLEYDAIIQRKPNTSIIIDWEDGTESTMTASDAHSLIFHENRQLIISANGTIFNSARKGIIPGLLEKWYSDRKRIQKELTEAKTTEEKVFLDRRQLILKINLNSVYGSLLNPYCRFFDERIGQSTTLTGRTITKHMISHINEIIEGDYDYEGRAIIYSDTDSGIFSAYPALKESIEKKEVDWNKETVIQLYDIITEQVNNGFTNFMKKAFHCPENLGNIIKAGREIAAETAMFIKKKRYAALMYDLDGNRLDFNGPGKMKVMGLDIKRSDTPTFIQEFLNDILFQVLLGTEKEEIIQTINEFKDNFRNKNSWEKGTPKRVNNLTAYTIAEDIKGKANLPGHVRAAMNWNTLRRMNSDNYSMKIVDGQKTIVCRLKNNPMGYTSVAYPIDEQRLPQWFLDLPFDDNHMEETIVNKKLKNVLGTLDWWSDDLFEIKKNNFDDLFTFN